MEAKVTVTQLQEVCGNKHLAFGSVLITVLLSQNFRWPRSRGVYSQNTQQYYSSYDIYYDCLLVCIVLELHTQQWKFNTLCITLCATTALLILPVAHCYVSFLKRRVVGATVVWLEHVVAANCSSVADFLSLEWKLTSLLIYGGIRQRECCSPS